jgi:prepilin-type N-terminal cleavage/methylation domain-containing protein
MRGCGRGGAARRRHAFTLIELIGVLAVIAILASLLIPKIFEAINSARISHAVTSCHTIKTAVVQHYAKFNAFASSNGVAFAVPGTYDEYDAILLAEGLIDKLFITKLGTNATIRLTAVSGLTANTSVDASNGAYDLDGDGKNNVVGAGYVVEAVIFDVAETDAMDLNDRIDGPALAGNPGGNDFLGRVIYHHGTPSQPLDVHIYLTHR